MYTSPLVFRREMTLTRLDRRDNESFLYHLDESEDDAEW